MEILESNLNIAEQALRVYDDFLYILKEKSRIEVFISEENHTIEEFNEEIRRYEETIVMIRKMMPFDIRLNMFLIECGELNEALISECESLINSLLDRIQRLIFHEKAPRISSEIKQIQDKLVSKADTSKSLVDLEKFRDEIENVKREQLYTDYKDLIDWLMMLKTHPRCKYSEDAPKIISTAFTWIQRINQFLETADNKLMDERNQIVNKLAREKTEFEANIQEIKVKVEAFKEHNEVRSAKDYKDEIAEINRALQEFTEEKNKINDDEADLEDEISEYPIIDELKKQIKPFETLWNLYWEYKEKDQKWEKSPILTLDPEEVEMDHKKMRN